MEYLTCITSLSVTNVHKNNILRKIHEKKNGFDYIFIWNHHVRINGCLETRTNHCINQPYHEYPYTTTQYINLRQVSKHT